MTYTTPNISPKMQALRRSVEYLQSLERARTATKRASVIEAVEAAFQLRRSNKLAQGKGQGRPGA